MMRGYVRCCRWGGYTCWDTTTRGSRYRQFTGDSQINGEIGAMSAESDLAGIEKYSKPCDGPNE